MTSTPLPAEFRQEMIAMLGESEGTQLLASYEQERLYGLRINTLKADAESAIAGELIRLFRLTPVPWCPAGFYYPEQVRPGRHPFHTAGLYYIQEPSAMSAVELLDPQPGETVLDLAAAPGGKSTQIAAKMQGQGVLVSNEIHPARAKILAENVERMGIANAVVTQGTPGELAARFPDTFDRIMLDAPCSGEGMFRKDEKAVAEWSPANVQLCAARQRDILHEAVRMLKGGGLLAYSTCTFNRAENEDNMSWLTAEYPEMELVEERRIWPHLAAGEGHYVALLRKRPGSEDAQAEKARGKEKDARPRLGAAKKNRKSAAESAPAAACLDWLSEHIPGMTLRTEEIHPFGEALYVIPQGERLTLTPETLRGLKLHRPGLKLGTYRKGRFEPDHALAMALNTDQLQEPGPKGNKPAGRSLSFSADAPEISAYLRGETLAVSPELKGWVLVAVEGFPLGWGKCSGGQLKNHLPKGLRQHGLTAGN